MKISKSLACALALAVFSPAALAQLVGEPVVVCDMDGVCTQPTTEPAPAPTKPGKKPVKTTSTPQTSTTTATVLKAPTPPAPAPAPQTVQY